NAPTRVEELWFSDGSLVVRAEQSLFRISGGILVARSSVFKDMLAFPQPPDAENIDGCPVVRLPDQAADVTLFFRAIFDSSFFEPFPTKTNLDIIISILHLSNKYAVDYLQRRALVHLSSRYPTTMSEYNQWATSTSLFPRVDDIAHHVAAIQISREVGALWILPAAFYQIAARDEEDVQTGLDCVSYNAHSVEFSGSDKLVFLKSSLQIARCANQITSFLHSPIHIPGCEGEQSTNARLRAAGKIHEYITGFGADADPLFLCKGAGVWTLLHNGCCQACFNFFVDTHEAARETLWNTLPKFCGLPPWEELEKMKAEAL
ncbi:hypothetical protein B0H17DRAFT_912302, partial [Mycena rosella]